VVRRKCVSCRYVKDKKKLIIVFKKYYTKVNRLFPSERMIPEVKQSRQLKLIKVAVNISSSAS
jgi:hypothetical protein